MGNTEPSFLNHFELEPLKMNTCPTATTTQHFNLLLKAQLTILLNNI
uniref:Uncharacterized protein n=1 Tax=Manihot esculenta TaxID=3983 RepID=A0A2C9U503_MANES